MSDLQDAFDKLTDRNLSAAIHRWRDRALKAEAKVTRMEEAVRRARDCLSDRGFDDDVAFIDGAA